jgi:tetratricopeptide (TPR) repeat protein
MPTPTTSQRTAEELFEAGRFEDALSAWREVAGSGPQAPRAEARIAACLIALGRHAEAVGILESLVEAAAAHPMLSYRLAVARAGTGDDEAALDALDRAAAAGVRLASGIDTETAFDRLRPRVRFVGIRDRIVANDAPTADDPHFRTFDFWVGDWEARTEDGILQGHNRIERVLGGAALIERWTGATGYRGISLNRYDRRADTWRQTWVDDQGDIVEFVDGVAADGRLAFVATDADGGRRRLTFTDGGPDAFRQLSERSDDDGRTWTVEYDFRYRRMAPDGR